jgi:hypothetical protein
MPPLPKRSKLMRSPRHKDFRLWRDRIHGLWSHGDWSPSNPPQTDPSFASGEIGFMAYGAMGIRTPDLLNAIEALYQLSYDPLPKPKQIAESVQCHNPIAKEIVLLAIPSSPSFLHDEPS